MWMSNDPMASTACDYEQKAISDWQGQDCMDWAVDAQASLQIPLGSWLCTQGFQYSTGPQLARFKVADFCQVVGQEYGPRYHRLFRSLIKKRNHQQAGKQLLNFSHHEEQQIPCWGGQPSSMEDQSQHRSLSPHFPSHNDLMLNDSFDSTFSPLMQTNEHFCLTEPSAQWSQPTSDSYYANNPGGYSTGSSDIEQMLSEMELSPFDLSYTDELCCYLGEESCDINNLSSAVSVPVQQAAPASAFACLSSPVPETSSDAALEKITTGKRGKRLRHPRSWEFLIRLLLCPTSNPSLIKWEDRAKGVFRLVNKDEIARRWGNRTEKHRMEPLSYDHFARVLRFHYKSGQLEAVSEKHLVYKFGPKIVKQLTQAGHL